MKNFTLSLLLFFGALMGYSQTVVTVTDDQLTGTTTWTNDNIYLLDGFVFLEEGTLTIEAGTVIKGKETPSTGDNASALIITTGAKINAVGTADNPIIFTAEDDDLSDPADLDVKLDRGLWGGVILLGNAVLGFNSETAQVEGIESTEARASYGGTDDSHNSGVMKYVSIRHGGAELSEDNEINGLTLAGVGSETVIEHIEVIANDDDGFEWFGGTVSCKWLVSAFNKDDAFDYDFGWRGNGQFWFVIQADDLADNGGEHDGAKDDDRTPFSKPTIYNATYIGSGADADAGDLKNSTALLFRDNAGGTYANSIFTDYKGHAVEVEDLASGVDSRQNMEAGDLVLKNNIWYSFGEGTELNAGDNGIIRATEGAEDATAQFLIDHMTNNQNSLVDPLLRGISRETDGGLDPRPELGSPVWTDLASYPEGEWFDEVPFKGAFGNANWATNWTATDEYGYFGNLPAGGSGQTVVVVDNDLNNDRTFYNDTTYLLDGFVFLEEGTLTIQAGTVIKGKETPSTGDNASALIITTGAKIDAVGTADNPIIFTAEDDDLSDPADLDVKLDRGLWGGVILLGNGVLGFNSETAQVEGIESTEARASYGGTDDTHNSGVMKYVSIRHGGAELSEDNEINGLTLAGVGSETVIEHIEVIANDDDGFEWFGGTVSCKWLVSAFNKDDAFDYDFGWRGNGQFWFVIQADDLADNGGEHDGAKDDDRTPFSKPTIYNATYIGSGANADAGDLKNSTALLFRDNAGGTYANSIFTDYKGHAVEVEDLASGVDSRQNMEAGDLVLKNNIWYGFGEGTELNAGDNGIIRATEGAEDATAQFLVTHMTNNQNTLVDPLLRGISRETDGGLDPRPHSHSPAFSLANADMPAGDWFTKANYIGAFGTENWATTWTAVDAYGYFGDITTNISSTKNNGFELKQNYPNPFDNSTTIEFTIAEKLNVNLSLFDVTGKLLKTLVNESKNSGTYKVEVSNLNSGMYFYQLIAGEQKQAMKMLVK